MKCDFLISAVDVGKYENIGVSWNQGDDISKKDFVGKFIKKLDHLKRGVIAIEAPLFIPADDFLNIAHSRKGKKDNCDYKIDQVDGMPRPWSMSASFHCAVQFLSILYSKITTKAQVFTDYHEFIKERSGILICEAFISGGMPDLKGKKREVHIEKWYEKKKINRHNHDAECAVKLLEKMFSGAIEPKKILCDKYLNLPSILIRENGNLTFCGTSQRGIIIKSPKPCFFEDTEIQGSQEIIELYFG